MDDDQLEYALKSMGKTCFVNYFFALSDESLSNDDIAELMLRNKEKWSTIFSRISNGRRIVRSGRGREALNLIAGSKVDEDVREKARNLRDGLS